MVGIPISRILIKPLSTMSDRVLSLSISESSIDKLRKGLPCKFDYKLPDGTMSIMLFHEKFLPCSLRVYSPPEKQDIPKSLSDSVINKTILEQPMDTDNDEVIVLSQDPSTDSNIIENMPDESTDSIKKNRRIETTVRQYDLDGNLIKTYNSIFAAAKELTSKPKSHLIYGSFSTLYKKIVYLYDTKSEDPLFDFIWKFDKKN
jgi:hypothetical protein